MTYRIDFTRRAAREVAGLDRVPRKRVLDAIERLGRDPRPAGARRLVGAEGVWRLRAGDYRVIYEIDDDVITVTVIRVAHRREVYR
ncbi:type II toxin-antitoxin system RelE family toxin [Demequina lignilytica]|uniref:Type II toxin-antitoxin system RelE/ParE family toxin n=1 Tax=Demequina lignilytica TaxID=3051663 RepID=A0AAW7M733_9MICO|nr:MULTISPECIES: type II toxin-antitoxin system RelE/ParE family toxin [unclassified Demequina]MDN4482067.1 type II toxin-antitoxin system RelE/ParE family toxin [Demequina sp. SYSU T0a273]MDN4486725.1 type II toxin-antitoxin system RelE/ParE family toxin [Demequina sp. SYSU T00039]